MCIIPNRLLSYCQEALILSIRSEEIDEMANNFTWIDYSLDKASVY